MFGVLPISDAIVGTDRYNPSKELEASLARDAAFKVATFAGFDTALLLTAGF